MEKYQKFNQGMEHSKFTKAVTLIFVILLTILTLYFLITTGTIKFEKMRKFNNYHKSNPFPYG